MSFQRILLVYYLFQREAELSFRTLLQWIKMNINQFKEKRWNRKTAFPSIHPSYQPEEHQLVSNQCPHIAGLNFGSYIDRNTHTHTHTHTHSELISQCWLIMKHKLVAKWLSSCSHNNSFQQMHCVCLCVCMSECVCVCVTCCNDLLLKHILLVLSHLFPFSHRFDSIIWQSSCLLSLHSSC